MIPIFKTTLLSNCVVTIFLVNPKPCYIKWCTQRYSLSLGPLLFLIMINDIDENVLNSCVSVFSDDTRITKVVKCEEDAEELQKDLESLYD